MSRVAAFVVLWIAFALVEVLLGGKFDPQQTPVGIALGAVAAFAVEISLHLSGVRFTPRLRWLVYLGPLARNIVRDGGLVGAAVLRRAVTGRLPDDRFTDVRFDPGGPDAESAARRALVIAGVSTPPNGIVLAVDVERRVLRVHQLVPHDETTHSPEWPL